MYYEVFRFSREGIASAGMPEKCGGEIHLSFLECDNGWCILGLGIVTRSALRTVKLVQLPEDTYWSLKGDPTPLCWEEGVLLPPYVVGLGWWSEVRGLPEKFSVMSTPLGPLIIFGTADGYAGRLFHPERGVLITAPPGASFVGTIGEGEGTLFVTRQEKEDIAVVCLRDASNTPVARHFIPRHYFAVAMPDGLVFVPEAGRDDEPMSIVHPDAPHRAVPISARPPIPEDAELRSAFPFGKSYLFLVFSEREKRYWVVDGRGRRLLKFSSPGLTFPYWMHRLGWDVLVLNGTNLHVFVRKRSHRPSSSRRGRRFPPRRYGRPPDSPHEQ